MARAPVRAVDSARAWQCGRVSERFLESESRGQVFVLMLVLTRCVVSSGLTSYKMKLLRCLRCGLTPDSRTLLTLTSSRGGAKAVADLHCFSHLLNGNQLSH